MQMLEQRVLDFLKDPPHDNLLLILEVMPRDLLNELAQYVWQTYPLHPNKQAPCGEVVAANFCGMSKGHQAASLYLAIENNPSIHRGMVGLLQDSPALML